jgi:hypothetical protein
MSRIRESIELLEILSEGAEDTGKAQENHVKWFLSKHGVKLAEVPVGAKYDIKISAGSPEKGLPEIFPVSLEPGEYEVKLKNPDGTLARLGSEKIRNLINDEYIASLVQLGLSLTRNAENIKPAIRGVMSGGRTEDLEGLFFGGDLPLSVALRSLEISSDRFEYISSQRFISDLTTLKSAIAKTARKAKAEAGKSEEGSEDTPVDITVKVHGSSIEVDSLSNLDRNTYDSRIAPVVRRATEKKFSSNLTNVLPYIEEVLQVFPQKGSDTVAIDWQMKLPLTASGGKLKGYFGVDIQGKIFYYPLPSAPGNREDMLRAVSLTQGGRLVMMTKGGYDLTAIAGTDPSENSSGGYEKLLDQQVGLLFGEIASAKSKAEKAKVEAKKKRLVNLLKGVRVPNLEPGKGPGKGNVFGTDQGVTFDDRLLDAISMRSDGKIPAELTLEEFIEENKPSGQQANESSTRGSKKTVKKEVSMGGVPGVTTPLGTDASGGKGGPGKRRGVKKGQSILDKNAATQGKNWGGAKRVNEVSNTINSTGAFGYVGGTASDFDGDGDSDGNPADNTSSVYRGGHGDLKRNAKQIGRHFCNAEVIEDTHELLQDLLSGKDLTPAQTRRFKRSAYDN